MSLWGGDPPRFDSIQPESSDQDDFYFRCPICETLFAVGRWAYDGVLIECDAGRCRGQFYADLKEKA